jgi:hypothetical protein
MSNGSERGFEGVWIHGTSSSQTNFNL